jgi:hypothetical protein
VARLGYIALLLLTIGLGLASRHWANALPGFVGTYVGDALWACAVYWAVAVVSPRARHIRRGLVALAIAVAVEVSQLFHPAWLDAIRATALGGRILGFGFLWSDLVSYVAGVGLAVLLDQLVSRRVEARAGVDYQLDVPHSSTRRTRTREH